MLKSIKKYGILVLIAMVVLTACMNKNARKNNYPVPGVDFTLPVGHVYTIDTLLTMLYPNYPSQSPWNEFKFTEDASVYGIVVADETSGNIYKAAYIQDGDAAIELYMKSTSGLRIGDSIRVYLKGATLSEYSGTPQIQDIDPNNITKLANEKRIEPIEISTLDVNTKYICHLVKFDHVEFPAMSRDSTFALEKDYGQHILNQYDDNCMLIDASIIVRTSNYASFGNKKLPQGNGSITGILTYYSQKSTWQFIIRSYSEVNMDNDPCEAPVTPPTGSGTQNDPYNISAAGLHQFDTDSLWIKGYIVGSVNVPFGTVVENDSQITWEPPFDVAANGNNVILADNADERNISNCVIVTLSNNTPSGIRNINLKDHPENLGKTLKVRGLLGANYGRNGMKKSNEFVLTD